MNIPEREEKEEEEEDSEARKTPQIEYHPSQKQNQGRGTTMGDGLPL